MCVAVALQQRRGASRVARAMQHGCARGTLVRPISHDENSAGSENRLHPDCHSAPGRVIAVEPFLVRRDRNSVELEHAGTGILPTTGLVETKMSVLAETENDDI